MIDRPTFELPELTATMERLAGVTDHHLQSVLLSAVLIAIFTACEVKWPSVAVANLRMRMTNISIGLIVAVFAFLCTLLISWLVPLLWPEGLIGL